MQQVTDEFAEFEWEVYEREVGSAYGCTVRAVKSFGAWQCLKEPGSLRADRVVSQNGQKPATK